VKLTGVEHRLTELEVKVAERQKATKLAATEYRRRLAELNNENARIRDFQSKVPSVDAFGALDDRVKILEATAGRLAGAAETRTESKSQSNITFNQILVIVGLVVAAFALLVEARHYGVI
jgi:hypothetical protein